MKLIITGGAGFIGGHLTRAALGQGHQVLIIDRQERLGLVDGAEFIKADLAEWRALRNNLSETDFVVHLAATVSVQECDADPGGSYKNNMDCTVAALEIARTLRAGVIYASSAAVYGDRRGPAKEDVVAEPINIYGLAKAHGESLCRIYGRELNLPWIALRMFNVYGSTRAKASRYAAVIPAFLRSAVESRPMVINGDGRQRRDFVYVEDVVSIFLYAMAHLESINGEIFNVGTGRSISIERLARLVVELTGTKAPITFGPQQKGDLRYSRACTKKGTSMLGTVPKTSIMRGLTKVIAEGQGV